MHCESGKGLASSSRRRVRRTVLTAAGASKGRWLLPNVGDNIAEYWRLVKRVSPVILSAAKNSRPRLGRIENLELRIENCRCFADCDLQKELSEAKRREPFSFHSQMAILVIGLTQLSFCRGGTLPSAFKGNADNNGTPCRPPQSFPATKSRSFPGPGGRRNCPRT